MKQELNVLGTEMWLLHGERRGKSTTHGPYCEAWRWKHHAGLSIMQLGQGGRRHEQRVVDKDSGRKHQAGSREPEPGGALD